MLVNLLIPAVLVRNISSQEFSVWSLSYQIISYVLLLGIGLQVATARAVAHAAEFPESSAGISLIVLAARSIARWATVIALAAVVGATFVYPSFFPQMPEQLGSEFRVTLALLGLTGVVSIISQVDMGIFQGLHRNSVFVGVQTGVRLLSLVAVLIGAAFGSTLVEFAGLFAVASALLWPAMRVAYRRISGQCTRKSASVPVQNVVRELLKYCATLSVWAICTTVVLTAGTLITGRIDFQSVGAYSLAMTASVAFAGLFGAALAPLITTGAAMYANSDSRGKLPALLISTSAWATLGLGIAAVLTVGVGHALLTLWVGAPLAEKTYPLLVVLVTAQAIRNIGAPYASLLLATGVHGRAQLSAILEAVANLVVSIGLGLLFGVVGVAVGSVVGGTVGIVGSLALNTGRTPELTPRPGRFIAHGIALPLLVVIPLFVIAMLWRF